MYSDTTLFILLKKFYEIFGLVKVFFFFVAAECCPAPRRKAKSLESCHVLGNSIDIFEDVRFLCQAWISSFF